jgi:phage terminase small subunit
VIVLDDAFKRWVALAKEYGLTALSRLKMQLETGAEADPEDELVRILRGEETAA